MRLIVIAYILTAGCGRPQEPLAPHPQGYAERMESADQHSRTAEAERRVASVPDRNSTSPTGYQCGDVALSDEATTGGKPIAPSIPCWDVEGENAEHHQLVADREQHTADRERRAATSLVEAEMVACRGLPARELDRSPFHHRHAIATVIPHRVTGTLRGVRVVWKPVLGLTEPWLRQAIACHRARFERLGEPPSYLSEDPTLVAGTTATVELRDGHLEVLIESGDATSGQVALGRAMDLIQPRAAAR